MDLNNPAQIKALDKSNMLGSIEALAKQCQQVVDDLKSWKVPAGYKNIKNIVVAGMGASGLGGHFVRSLFGDKLRVPLAIVNDYHLPGSADKNTLVILSSYSGSTEETLSCAKEAKTRGTKVLVITAGKQLAEMKKKNHWPGYIFAPKHNPCNSPRMGLGYSLMATFLLLGKIGLIKFGPAEAIKAIKAVEKYTPHSEAKELAKNLVGKIPFFFGAGWLAANLHTLSNQINENAKTFGGWFLLPEINHHLLEGLVQPEVIGKDAALVFFESTLDDKKMQQRITISKEVVKKSGLSCYTHRLEGKDKISQAFEFLVLGSYVSFYLAMMYEIDPTPIPAVNYFKERL